MYSAAPVTFLNRIQLDKVAGEMQRTHLHKLPLKQRSVLTLTAFHPSSAPHRMAMQFTRSPSLSGTPPNTSLLVK